MRKGFGPFRGARGGPDARFWVGGAGISVDVVFESVRDVHWKFQWAVLMAQWSSGDPEQQM